MENTANISTTLTGIQVKHRLLDLGKRQAWLIEQMKKKNKDMFMDSSYMARLLDGTEKSAPKMKMIEEILQEEEERQKWNHDN